MWLETVTEQTVYLAAPPIEIVYLGAVTIETVASMKETEFV